MKIVLFLVRVGAFLAMIFDLFALDAAFSRLGRVLFSEGRKRGGGAMTGRKDDWAGLVFGALLVGAVSPDVLGGDDGKESVICALLSEKGTETTISVSSSISILGDDGRGFAGSENKRWILAKLRAFRSVSDLCLLMRETGRGGRSRGEGLREEEVEIERGESPLSRSVEVSMIW